MLIMVALALASSSTQCKDDPATDSTPSFQMCEYNRADDGLIAKAMLWSLPTTSAATTPAAVAAGQPITLAYTFWEGLCLDGGKGVDRTPVKLINCDPTRAKEQGWTVKPLKGDSDNGGAVFLVHTVSGLCASIAHASTKIDATLDLTPCTTKDNLLFNLTARTATPPSPGLAIVAADKHRCLSACRPKTPAPSPPPGPPPGPTPPLGSIVFNGSALGIRYDGYWAMAVNGAARLLFEYAEPARTELLDLFFTPRGVGTAWQGLKVEIGGDVESSYGSMTSFMHTSNVSEASFTRGVIWWLIVEARKRNPKLPLAALSWGMPSWVGNGTTLSPGGGAYHVDWLLGAKKHYNLTFDFVGIWNEAPWTADYIILFRKQLDDAGLHSTQIMAADGDTSVIKAAQRNATLAAAIGAFGVHTSKMMSIDTLGKPYYESENDIVDGPMPQWNGSNRVGLHWPKQFISNVVEANGTAAMLCAFAHGWSQNLGRHNHGPAMLNDPWSGFYQLGAGFFTQAHVTQFTVAFEDRFVGSAIEKDKHGKDRVSYAALASHDGAEITVVATNEDVDSAQLLEFTLVGALKESLCQSSASAENGEPPRNVLERWQSNSSSYFTRVEDLTLSISNCSASVMLPPGSVTTLSSRVGVAGWVKDYEVPARTRWKLPYAAAYATQTLETPCEMLSPIYGSFEVTAGPGFHRSDHAEGDSGDGVCTQAVPVNPGPNAWTHRANGWPVALLPSGSNAVNLDAVAIVAFDDVLGQVSGGTDPEPEALTLCGRVPIWSPSSCMPPKHAIGVCLSLLREKKQNGTVSWRLTEAHNDLHQPKTVETASLRTGAGVGFSNACKDLTVLASGFFPLSGVGVGVGAWATLALSFDDERVTVSINGNIVAANVTTHVGLGGAVALGTGWNVGHFRSLSTTHSPVHPPTANSFLFDLVPSETLVKPGAAVGAMSDDVQWAGFILDLSADPEMGRRAAPSMTVTKFGRFKSVGNTHVHCFGVWDASSSMWALSPPAHPDSTCVDMSNCVTDALGFCYGGALVSAFTFASGGVFYVVSSEGGIDTFVEMTASATGTDMGHRNGDTFMTYAVPLERGAAPMAAASAIIAGRVSAGVDLTRWAVHDGSDDIDTSFGPINMVLLK